MYSIIDIIYIGKSRERKSKEITKIHLTNNTFEVLEKVFLRVYILNVTRKKCHW